MVDSEISQSYFVPPDYFITHFHLLIDSTQEEIRLNLILIIGVSLNSLLWIGSFHTLTAHLQ